MAAAAAHPGLRALATKDVLADAQTQAAGIGMYSQRFFVGQVPDDPARPELLKTDTIAVDGHELPVIDLGQGDIEHSTILHVPQHAAVIAGDLCYNNVHMMTAFTDDAAREAWIANLDTIAAMNPRTVVSGHKRVGAPDLPETIGQSQQYLRDFTRVAAEQDTVAGIINGMLDLHGDRDNPYTLYLSARLTIANRKAPGASR